MQHHSALKLERNFMIQGLNISTIELLVDELNRISGNWSSSNISMFNYDNVNDITIARLKRGGSYAGSSYLSNDNLLKLSDTTRGDIDKNFIFRSANYVTEINLPNKLGSTVSKVNTFNIQCARLESLNISSVERLTHNYIFTAPFLTNLDVSSVIYADTRSIRGVGRLEVLDMKKCKYLGEDGHQPDFPIFTGLKSTITINLNSFLLTSNNGSIDPYLDNLSTYYQNSIINLYDDLGNLVTTL